MAKINGLNSDVFSFTNEFQRNIIVMMIQNPEIFERVGILVEPNCFEIKEYRDIFRSMKSYYNEYKCLPTKEILYNEVKKVNDNENLYKDIDGIYNNILLNSGSVEYIENQIKEFVSYQAIKKAVIDSIDDINDTDKYTQIKDRIEKAVNIKAMMEDNGVDVYSDDAIIDRWYNKREDNDTQIISTGWNILDEKLGGGFETKTLTSIFGVANSGKSQYLINFGANFLMQQKNVLYISLEMSEDLIIQRMDSRLLGLTQNDIKKRDDVSSKKMIEVLDKHIGKFIVKQFPATTITADDIVAFMNKIETINNIKIDMLIIDYCDIMKPSHRYNDKRHEIDSIYIETRNIAITKNIVVLTATQLNRSGLQASKTGAILDSEYIANDYGIIRTLDTGLFLTTTPSGLAENKTILYIGKNRNGAMGDQIIMYTDYSKCFVKPWCDTECKDLVEEKRVTEQKNIEQQNNNRNIAIKNLGI